MSRLCALASANGGSAMLRRSCGRGSRHGGRRSDARSWESLAGLVVTCLVIALANTPAWPDPPPPGVDLATRGAGRAHRACTGRSKAGRGRRHGRWRHSLGGWVAAQDRRGTARGGGDRGALVVLGVVAMIMLMPHPHWMAIARHAAADSAGAGWRREWRRRERRADCRCDRTASVAHWPATARSPTLSRHARTPHHDATPRSRRLPARHRVRSPVLCSRAGAAAFERVPDARRWRQPIAPFRIADHTWYVGTAGPERAAGQDAGRRGADRRRLAAGGRHAAGAHARTRRRPARPQADPAQPRARRPRRPDRRGPARHRRTRGQQRRIRRLARARRQRRPAFRRRHPLSAGAGRPPGAWMARSSNSAACASPRTSRPAIRPAA